MIYKWLDTCLDIGITEFEFWNMTIRELINSWNSYKRNYERRLKEQSEADYILADLIGRSIARVYSSSATMPPIDEVYPHLFDSKEIQEIKQQKKDELSIARFKQFANAHNSKFKEAK